MAIFYMIDDQGNFRGTTNNPDQQIPDGWSISNQEPTRNVTRPRDNALVPSNLNSEVFQSNFFNRPKVLNWVRDVFQVGIDAEEVIDLLELFSAWKNGNNREFRRIARKHSLINFRVRFRGVIRFRVRRARASIHTQPGGRIRPRPRVRFILRGNATVVSS